MAVPPPSSDRRSRAACIGPGLPGVSRWVRTERHGVSPGFTQLIGTPALGMPRANPARGGMNESPRLRCNRQSLPSGDTSHQL